MIDTADIYSVWVQGNKGGESETILGRWMKARKNRDRVLIATKVGMEMAPNKKGLSQKHIFASVEDSLKRLQTDWIDLYYSHEDDPSVPIEEPLAAYSELKKQGKIRAIGASNFKGARLEEALNVKKIPTYQCLQTEYNLMDRFGYEKELEPICSRHHLGVLTYYSLASGFLTGKFRSEKESRASSRSGTLQKYFTERGTRVLNALDEVAKRYQANPTQIALAWLLTRPNIAAPIASATRIEQLQDLFKGVTLHLDSDAVALLDRASSDIA
jgi:aryl-alcohol dehydrogenase-like predicted oxidoreductase